MKSLTSIRKTGLKLCFSVAVYLSIMIFQNVMPNNSIFQGVFSQIQVVLSLYMILLAQKTGYHIALVVNGLQLIQVVIYVVFSGNLKAIPGMVVPITTVLVCRILWLSFKRLNGLITESQVKEVALEENAKMLHEMAYHDQLTGLPNRQQLIKQLNLLCDAPEKEQKAFALVLIDLDNFTNVNDALGYKTGDRLLRAVSAHLNRARDPSDFLARWGGDEFALIIDRALTDQEVYRTVVQYKKVLYNVPVRENFAIGLSASFGVAFFPRHSNNAPELIDYADTAMYNAKNKGRDTICMFTNAMKEALHHKFDIEQHLIFAQENQELSIVYQPQYRIADHSLRGFEALLRWHSAKLGLISPSQFIPMAENSGLILRWGNWILEEACARFIAIQNQIPETTRLSVNISTRQMMHPTFLSGVKGVLLRTGMPPERLELEITESVFITDVEKAVQILKKLRALGVHLALDDFGIGYSSLNLLPRIPIETLKIDQSFLHDLNSVPKTEHVVESVIHMAHQMNMEVIAEGVEAEEQLDFLANHLCDTLQGYLWGRPMTLLDWLSREKPIPLSAAE